MAQVIEERKFRTAATDKGSRSLPEIRRKPTGVSARAFSLGLLFSLIICAVLPYNDYYVAATYLSGNFFPISALAGMLVLVLFVNPLLIAIGQRKRIWSAPEILTVFFFHW